MKFASLDAESAIAFPDEMVYDEEHFHQLGITCAAVALVDTDVEKNWHETENIRFWHSDTIDRLSKEDCQSIVYDMWELAKEGYIFVTWNGTGFDFRLLAVQSGLYGLCARMAYKHHIDMMLFVVFLKGHFLGLQKALEGIGSPGKLHDVTLSDGTIIDDMKGALAPELWSKGEFEAVLLYLNFDVTEPLKLLQYIYAKKRIQWLSKKGNPQTCSVPNILTVEELYTTVMPDSNLERNEITLDQFFGWMPFYQRVKHK